MRILEFKVNYEPEIAAGIDLDANTAEDLAAAGHEVFLYVPTPTRGISEEITRKTPKSETKADGKLRIYRYSMYREGKSSSFRAVRYLLCCIKQTWFGLRCKKAELIFAGSTPPIQGPVAAFIKKVRGIPFVYNCQDIFPDSMVTAGMTSEGSVSWKIGNRIADITYKAADRIIVISESMKNNLISKGVPSEKIKVVRNWIDESFISPVERSGNLLAKELGIPEFGFTVLYAGNLGHAQGAEVIIKAAERLKDRPEIGFVIFGAGACLEEFRRSAKDLDNVHIFPLQPFSRVPEVYSIGDACIVSCKPGTGGNAMPSKVWTIMGCERPVLASFDSGTDLDSILEDCGMISPAGDAGKLAENILSLSFDKENCTRLGRNARDFVRTNATRSVCTAEIRSIIEKAREDHERTRSR